MRRRLILSSLLFALALLFYTNGCVKTDAPLAPTLVSSATPTPAGGCQVVSFPDANLEAKIRVAVGKPTGDICRSDCEGIASLTASASFIADISGIEYCINLTDLNLQDNFISDIGPLSGLTNLTVLNLGSNSISDISPLSGLTNLTGLDLALNSVSDLSPLSGMTNLTWLFLYTNSISDLTPLSGLTNLTMLALFWNSISDLTPLSGLTNLTDLSLGTNLIVSIDALVVNCDAGGFGSGDYIDLFDNPLGADATTTDIPYLESKGVTVHQ